MAISRRCEALTLAAINASGALVESAAALASHVKSNGRSRLCNSVFVLFVRSFLAKFLILACLLKLKNLSNTLIEDNAKCADCGTKPVEWASASRGVTLCVQCSGAHRALG